MAGATAPGEYLWVRREQRRPEGKANVLGRQLRLEGFGGKAIFLLVDGSHTTSLMLFTASTHLSGLEERPTGVTQAKRRGLFNSVQGLHKDCTSSAPPTPGFRNAVSQTPQVFPFLPTHPPPLPLTICDFKICGDLNKTVNKELGMGCPTVFL